MIIRRATIADAEALAKIHVDSWRVAYRGLVPDGYLANLSYAQRTQIFKDNIPDSNSETFCADLDNSLVGLLTIGPCRDDDVDSLTTGEIWGIYLSPEHWRKGVGSQLCQYGEGVLREKGYQQIILWVFEENDSARRFYEAMGFSCDGGEKTYTIGGEALQGIRYRKVVQR